MSEKEVGLWSGVCSDNREKGPCKEGVGLWSGVCINNREKGFCKKGVGLWSGVCSEKERTHRQKVPEITLH